MSEVTFPSTSYMVLVECDKCEACTPAVPEGTAIVLPRGWWVLETVDQLLHLCPKCPPKEVK